MNQSAQGTKIVLCSICHGSADVALKDAQLGLYRCVSCRHTFMQIDQREEEKYESGYFSQTHKNWFSHPNYPLFDFIYNKIQELKSDRPLKVIDVGCGRGDFLKYLRSRDSQLRLYGIDLTENKAEGISFLTGDILEARIGETFDVVVNLAVIEHVKSPAIFMKKLFEVTVPGGRVFTLTVNSDGMIFKAAGFLNRLGFKAAYNRIYSRHHLQYFSPRSLALVAEKQGFASILQRNQNYPLCAVDYPEASPFVVSLYKAAVGMVFALSSLMGNGMLQLLVCQKRGQRS